jgi:hypothetical protein
MLEAQFGVIGVLGKRLNFIIEGSLNCTHQSKRETTSQLSYHHQVHL